MKEPVKVLIIHDDMRRTDPLIFSLEERYGKENVILEKRSSKGIEYILENLTSKIIVLLDFDLGIGEPHAPEVFKKIREKTSLIYVIIYTAKEFSNIPHKDLIDFINNDALGIIQSTADMSEVLTLINSAAHELETRVDCILEEWISKRSDGEKNEPYLTTKSNEVYTLNDLIIEIRKQTEVGQKLEKSVLQLAIDLLTTNQKKLDD